MIVPIIYLIICIILDGLMSNVFPSTISHISYFMTIYTIIGLTIIYPYFNSNKKYYILVIVFAFIFDTMYTSTFLVNIIIFLLVTIVIRIFSNILSDNIFMSNIISLISITTYHILSFIILNVLSYSKYSFALLGNVLLHSIIMTIIYTSISYVVVNYMFDKKNVKYIK